MSLAEQLKAKAGQRECKDIEIAGLTVRLQTLTAAERCRVEVLGLGGAGLTGDKFAEFSAMLIAFCVCDPASGECCFSDADLDTILALPGELFSALSIACLDHCGMAVAADEIGDAAKN